MIKANENYRDRRTPGLMSNSTYGNNGCFVFPHYRITGYEIRCIISDGSGWEHCSVSIAPKGKAASRCPTWEEMCWVKDQFWAKNETVVQFHPMESEYVNCHPYCLHLWKQVNKDFELPPSIMVGLKTSL